MTDTTLGVSADTKQAIDAAKPDGHTHDEFIRALLNDGVETRTYVDAEDVLEELNDEAIDPVDVGMGATDIQEAARQGVKDALDERL